MGKVVIDFRVYVPKLRSFRIFWHYDPVILMHMLTREVDRLHCVRTSYETRVLQLPESLMPAFAGKWLCAYTQASSCALPGGSSPETTCFLR